VTCIVGVVENNKVYIGGDSAGVAGYSLTIRKDKKVFRNGEFLIGGTSSFRMIQLLHYAFEPPPYDENIDLEKYMATAFVDAIRECFKRGGYAQVESQQESGGHFLIGFRGRLFHVEADYQVGEALSSYDAVGCGADVALGCLYATPDMQSLKRIELALRAAEAHSAGVRAPFFIESL
jgi:ATP-dependent protease HslVU (ClpYQ) peptidase subunit